MIEDPPLLQIRRRFDRPTAAQVQAFAGLQTGFVVDALGGRGALDRHVKPIGDSAPFCGVALPCFCGPDDNLAAFGTLSVAQPGDVVLAAAEGFDKAAVIGDLMLGMMKNVGIAAFVTDGWFLDIADGTAPERPIELQHVHGAGQAHVRLPVRVGAGVTATVVQRTLDAAQPGEIVLMHVGANPDDGTVLDAHALPEVIAGLRAAGYGFVTVDRLRG